MSCCDNYVRMTRRRLLTAAGAMDSFAALARRGDAQVDAGSVSAKATAEACIFINLSGAPSHLDTFDPKDGPWNPPDANLRQHGNLILSGTFFPNLSRYASDLCVLRSVSSWEAAHERGPFY